MLAEGFIAGKCDSPLIGILNQRIDSQFSVLVYIHVAITVSTGVSAGVRMQVYASRSAGSVRAPCSSGSGLACGGVDSDRVVSHLCSLCRCLELDSLHVSSNFTLKIMTRRRYPMLRPAS